MRYGYFLGVYGLDPWPTSQQRPRRIKEKTNLVDKEWEKQTHIWTVAKGTTPWGFQTSAASFFLSFLATYVVYCYSLIRANKKQSLDTRQPAHNPFDSRDNMIREATTNEERCCQ